MKINTQNRILFFILILFFVTSCKTKQKLTTSSPIKKITTKSKISTEDLLKYETDFKTFQSKSKTHISLDGKSYDVNLSLRIKKGEIIWASITAFAGMEVARILITPDTIKLMNRMESEYTIKPFSFIHTYTSNKIDFTALESLLIGNSIPFTLSKGDLDLEENQATIKGTEGSLSFNSRYSNLLKPVNVQLQNNYSGQQLSIRYSNYSLFTDKQLPVNLTIISKINLNNINLDIEYQAPQFDISQDYPFNVPKRYTLIK